MGLPSGARAAVDRFNRNRPDRRNDDPDRDKDDSRPRTAGSLGKEGGDPTKEGRGLIEQAEDFLAQKDKEIRAALGADPFQESFRPGPRAPNDERPSLSLLGQNFPPPPAGEEEIIPGDPSDLGARGRRRRTTDDVNASPVLRRGLLGV